MRLMGKQFFDVKHGDLEELGDLRISESETLEFKAELPGGGADDRREIGVSPSRWTDGGL